MYIKKFPSPTLYCVGITSLWTYYDKQPFQEHVVVICNKFYNLWQTLWRSTDELFDTVLTFVTFSIITIFSLSVNLWASVWWQMIYQRSLGPFLATFPLRFLCFDQGKRRHLMNYNCLTSHLFGILIIFYPTVAILLCLTYNDSTNCGWETRKGPLYPLDTDLWCEVAWTFLSKNPSHE